MTATCDRCGGTTMVYTDRRSGRAVCLPCQFREGVRHGKEAIARMIRRNPPLRLTALLIVLGLLPACTHAGTFAKYDPTTHEFQLVRPWLGGPVDFELEVDTPDGTHIRGHWRSDVELDAAQAVEFKRQETLQRTISTIEALALPKDKPPAPAAPEPVPSTIEPPAPPLGGAP